MVEIDDPQTHIIRTQNIDLKIDSLSHTLSIINDRLYAILETNPEAKKKFEKIQELRAKE